jgi:hypothetical protein
MEVPTPSDVFNPDPAGRGEELKDAVASDGPQSLALVLAAAQDPNVVVRAASEQLLLNDLRDVVPRETLSTMALTSKRADIRLQALEALAERQQESRYVVMTLESARRDADPKVKQRAEDLLIKLSD